MPEFPVIYVVLCRKKLTPKLTLSAAALSVAPITKLTMFGIALIESFKHGLNEPS